MSTWGGAREGAGRPAGTMNRRSVEMVAELVGNGQSPLAYLVGLYQDENADPKDRAWAANAVAPYLYGKQPPAQPRVELQLPDTSTADGVRDAIAVVVQAVATGEIAPAEGQNVIGVIEAQRKAIETADIMERLDALEAASAVRGKR